MTPVKAIIVDDEEQGRANLENLVSQYCPGIEVVGKADSAVEARGLVLQKQPDLIFLDIEMPDENGIDLLRSLGENHCHIIFVTAHDRYAIQALRLSAVDYLLKPFGIKDLQVATQKVMLRLQKNMQEQNPQDTGTDEAAAFLSETGNQLRSERITLSSAAGFEIIYKNLIIRVQGDNNYSTIVTEKKKYLISRTLKDFEQVLDARQFIRVHKTHIVNLQYVDHVHHHRAEVMMADGSTIDIARRRYTEFLNKLSFFAPIFR